MKPQNTTIGEARGTASGRRSAEMRLFEFGDQPWLPKVLREGEVAYLAACYKQVPLALTWADQMIAALQPRGHINILDLCSGAGGPLEQIVDEFHRRGQYVSVTLSDLYPSARTTRHASMTWHPSPVDARCVPPELMGVRTMFSAFHHFNARAARDILGDAFRRRRPICIFEGGSGTYSGFVSMILVPLNVLAIMPFARPFRWKYLLLTYLIPVLPLLVFWDGMVSMLRIHSPERMKEMVRDFDAPDYLWDIGRLSVPRIPGGLPYLIGRPSLQRPKLQRPASA